MSVTLVSPVDVATSAKTPVSPTCGPLGTVALTIRFTLASAARLMGAVTSSVKFPSPSRSRYTSRPGLKSSAPDCVKLSVKLSGPLPPLVRVYGYWRVPPT